MTSKRNFGLDALRALAIGTVLLGHGVSALGVLAVGVDLFFVLSGFLVGRIYFRWRRGGYFQLSKFWIERWWRTLPPYIAALGLYALAEHWIPSNPVNWWYLLFLQTFTGLTGFEPSWSLCVEEHFYLALPLLAMAAERIVGRKNFTWLLPAAFLAPTLLRISTITYLGGLEPWMAHRWYRTMPYHCDGLIVGVYLAYLFVERPQWFALARRPALWCAPLVVVPDIARLFFGDRLVIEYFEYPVRALGFAAWLQLAYTFSWQPLTFVGRLVERSVRGLALISYSVYLLHVLVLTDLHVLLNNWTRGVAKTSFILSATLMVSTVFYFLIERTSIITRDRFLHRSDLLPNPVPEPVAVPAASLSSALGRQ
jgi:peptidoglycan/LPS O-acetylase OafA/YrhL